MSDNISDMIVQWETKVLYNNCHTNIFYLLLAQPQKNTFSKNVFSQLGSASEHAGRQE